MDIMLGTDPNPNYETIHLQPANPSFPGVVTIGPQAISGVHTFGSPIRIGGLEEETSPLTLQGTPWLEPDCKNCFQYGPNRVFTRIIVGGADLTEMHRQIQELRDEVDRLTHINNYFELINQASLY